MTPSGSILHSRRNYAAETRKDLTYEKKFAAEHNKVGLMDVFAFVGFAKAQELEKKYLPKEMLEARYSQASVGNFGKTVTTVEKK